MRLRKMRRPLFLVTRTSPVTIPLIVLVLLANGHHALSHVEEEELKIGSTPYSRRLNLVVKPVLTRMDIRSLEIVAQELARWIALVPGARGEHVPEHVKEVHRREPSQSLRMNTWVLHATLQMGTRRPRLATMQYLVQIPLIVLVLGASGQRAPSHVAEEEHKQGPLVLSLQRNTVEMHVPQQTENKKAETVVHKHVRWIAWVAGAPGEHVPAHVLVVRSREPSLSLRKYQLEGFHVHMGMERQRTKLVTLAYLVQIPTRL